ncbi:hypothetical protein FOB89_19935 [Shewanella putrefaciens]|uniref:Uncharacterized protein n=1 Tax=Shewanella putrefaciens (strain 200) TaxID=399804 RepID=E6XJK0_SHEP2|nr:hypothetical protein FOB89_19935 [Shewanella putrefaciens]
MWFVAHLVTLLLLPVISLALFSGIICWFQWHCCSEK